MEQIEIIVKLIEIFVKYNQGTGPWFGSDCEMRMYGNMLETSRELLRLLDEKSVEELYVMRYFVGNKRPDEHYELMKE